MDDVKQSQKKARTVSVRMEEDLNRHFEEVCNKLSIDKSDFIRSCVDTLCNDNRLALEHQDKIPEYISYIKREMSKLPKTIVAVKNGSWKKMEDITVVMVADSLFYSSRKFWDLWKKITDNYGIDFEDSMGDTIEEFNENPLLQLEDLGMLVSGQSPIVYIDELLDQEMWVDDLEFRKITLILALKEAIAKYSAKNLMEESLETVSRRVRESKPLRIVIDAKGKFERTLTGLGSPITYEPIED